MVDQIAKNRADVHFKVREQQKADVPLARMEYEAAGVALRENTARLRALRLARDANLPREKTRLRKATRLDGQSYFARAQGRKKISNEVY